MEMLRRIYFVGFQSKNRIGNVTVNKVSEHSVDSYMNMISEIAKGIEELYEMDTGSVIITSLTILFEEKVVDNSSRQDIS